MVRRNNVVKNTTFMDEIRKHSINYYISEANLHTQKEVEGVIREIGNNWFKTMIRKRYSRQLWDYRIVWCSEIMSLTNSKAGVLGSVIPLEDITSETPDISVYLHFGFLLQSMIL